MDAAAAAEDVFANLAEGFHVPLSPASLAFCLFGAAIGTFVGILPSIVFKALDCNPAPLVLALVLDPLLESNFRRAVIVLNGDVTTIVTPPISLAILI